MKIASIVLGSAVTAVLLLALVVTRLMVLVPVKEEIEIRDVETVTLPEPPVPPVEEIPEEDVPPPPPLAVTDLRITENLSQPALPVALTKVDPRLAVDTFFTDQLPAPLPTFAKPRPRPVVKRSSPKPKRPTIKRQLPKPKSEYALSELDRKPRLIRNPSVTFPRNIRDARSGRVVVRVAILPSGRSQYLSTISSTHSALLPLARRIANGSRFTSPTRHGKPVRAVMIWPIIIKK